MRRMIDNEKDDSYGTEGSLPQTTRECPYLWTFLLQIYDLRIPER